MSVIHTQFSAIMDVDGTIFEIVQFGSDFAVNTIPTAEVIVAIGRKAGDGTTAATIHSALDKLTPEKTVKVYLCAVGQWSDTLDWPTEAQLIFEGRIANIGYTKVMGKVQLVIRLVHWLMDLNNSSAVSAQSHPGNPSEYTFQTIFSSSRKAGVTGQPGGMAGTAEAAVIKVSAIREDLWGKVIKKLFCSIATGNRLAFTADLKRCTGVLKDSNAQALAALKRMEGESDDDCTLVRSCYTPALAMTSASISAPITVANTIYKHLRFDTVQSFVHSTLWGKLVTYSGTFGAAIIPLVDRALFVPWVPGHRDTFCKTIQNCDYSYLNLSSDVKQLLYGMVLMGTKEYQSGVVGAGREITSLAGLGGCYVPDKAAGGMIKFIGPPAWLANIPYGGHSAKKPVGLDGAKKFSTATTPQDDTDTELVANKDGLAREAIIQETSEMYNDYAKYMYVVEALRGRFGSISGKLRFDIAPGSTVVIAGSSELFLEGEDALAQNLVATVLRVSIGINAESGQAGTTFMLGHIRTEAENEDDRFSVDKHPLYPETFVGAPLQDALWFKEEGSGCC
jgi:hypothetical protein